MCRLGAVRWRGGGGGGAVRPLNFVSESKIPVSNETKDKKYLDYLQL
jgi:hypothetical protein